MIGGLQADWAGFFWRRITLAERYFQPPKCWAERLIQRFIWQQGQGLLTGNYIVKGRSGNIFRNFLKQLNLGRTSIFRNFFRQQLLARNILFGSQASRTKPAQEGPMRCGFSQALHVTYAIMCPQIHQDIRGMRKGKCATHSHNWAGTPIHMHQLHAT